LLAMALTMAATASAQWDGRLWKPYQSEQFGGSRRSADGLYGSVEAIYWKLDGPKNLAEWNTGALIGMGDGEQFQLAGSLEAEAVPSPNFNLGTRFTLGYQQGHHGWRFTGCGLSGCGSGVAMSTRVGWSEQGDYLYDFMGTGENEWTWINIRSYVGRDREGKDYGISCEYQTRLFDLDLAWTYRTHPFKWGELEFFAGAKYWDLNDKLSFADEGMWFFYNFSTDTLWEGTSRYDYDVIDILAYNGVIPLEMEISSRQIREATNRMVGPNLGFNLTRRNSRWTFGAAPSVFLGVNNQTFTFNEYGTSRFNEVIAAANTTVGDIGYVYNSMASSFSVGELLNLKQARSLLKLPVTYYHKQHRTVFSPGVSLQLSAKWQWTDAVGIKVSFDSTVMQNVARGSDLVATPVQYEQTPGVWVNTGKYDFSYHSKGDTVILYGISIGLEMKR